jgi:hypothetical protein
VYAVFGALLAAFSGAIPVTEEDRISVVPILGQFFAGE